MGYIEKLAKYKHAILLGLAGLATCIPLGMIFNSPVNAQEVHQPSVHKELLYKTFKSQGLTNLLVHHFGMQDDKDIATSGHIWPISYMYGRQLTQPKRNRIYELNDGGGLSALTSNLTFNNDNWLIKNNHKWFSEVSDKDKNRFGGNSMINYDVYKNYLIFSQFTTTGDLIPNSISDVKYQLIKVSKEPHHDKVLIFTPISFSLVNKHKETIPKKVQKQNLLKLTILRKTKWKSVFPASS